MAGRPKADEDNNVALAKKDSISARMRKPQGCRWIPPPDSRLPHKVIRGSPAWLSYQSLWEEFSPQ